MSVISDDRSELHHRVHHNPSSISAQLATWHANRGDRSFVSAMVPRWSRPQGAVKPPTKNPFKLCASVSGKAWLLFFSAWFAWTVDGYDFFAVSLTNGRLSEQFGKSTKVSCDDPVEDKD